ncbi:methyltransferase domain-containing protein [Amycolatopsis sp. NPDC059027]|uniref:methyltransferase domain-containing protein n=1 Tax=Amycolatopsis sp. NPDC059027 TaxID=3346709 RepID=UPI00366D18A2
MTGDKQGDYDPTKIEAESQQDEGGDHSKKEGEEGGRRLSAHWSVDDAIAAGHLSAEWRPAFERAPRTNFVPEGIWIPSGDGYAWTTRSADPDAWQAAVSADRPVVTQVDDGKTKPGEIGGSPTSSGSMPTVVALMLDALDVAPEHRVLEIGTGTGWNAALLTARLCEDHVTTVEVDPDVCASAKTALRDAGLNPTVVCADGEDGYAPNAPYDRVIATASVYRVPQSWIAQTRPGGLIIAPWITDWHNAALLRLSVKEDNTAVGRFDGNVSFMRLRAQRDQHADCRVCDIGETGPTTETITDRVIVRDTMADIHGSFFVGLGLPDVYHYADEADSGRWTAVHIHEIHGSWATIDLTPATPTVRQSGPRRLWDEVAALHAEWVERGKPEYTRFGLTVTPDRQDVWLGAPESVR